MEINAKHLTVLAYPPLHQTFAVPTELACATIPASVLPTMLVTLVAYPCALVIMQHLPLFAIIEMVLVHVQQLVFAIKTIKGTIVPFQFVLAFQQLLLVLAAQTEVVLEIIHVTANLDFMVQLATCTTALVPDSIIPAPALPTDFASVPTIAAATLDTKVQIAKHPPLIFALANLQTVHLFAAAKDCACKTTTAHVWMALLEMIANLPFAMVSLPINHLFARAMDNALTRVSAHVALDILVHHVNL